MERLAKAKNISVIVGVIGILIAIFNYLGPIKNYTEQIPSMAIGISYIQGRTDALISKNEGGKLTSLDARVVVTTKPEDVINDALLKYVPVSTEMQPAELPPEVTVTGYGFVLIPYSLSNVQLPESPFQEARLTIIYTDDDLQLAGGKPENLIIQSWDEQLGEWKPLATTVEGRQLSAIIEKPTWFTLSAYTQSQ